MHSFRFYADLLFYRLAEQDKILQTSAVYGLSAHAWHKASGRPCLASKAWFITQEPFAYGDKSVKEKKKHI